MLIPLAGHTTLRSRLLKSIERDTLPHSILFYGPAGVGKQRLALWLAQRLVCAAPVSEGVWGGACGSCQHCRMTLALTHPDIHWVFPLPRPKDSDFTPNDARDAYAEVKQERAEAQGLYAPPSGMDGIFMATVRMLLAAASLTPALARRKVIVAGDAERMVPQESAPDAANAFLKLLEEPPNDTWLLLTSSAPAALLPTIRSRVAPLRVAPLPHDQVRTLVESEAFAAALKRLGAKGTTDELVRRAAGAPGALLGAESDDTARKRAKEIIQAATSNDPQSVFRVALMQGGSGARGTFREVLDEVTRQLYQQSRVALDSGQADRAVALSKAIDLVEEARETTDFNVNPSLVTASLVEALARSLR